MAKMLCPRTVRILVLVIAKVHLLKAITCEHFNLPEPKHYEDLSQKVCEIAEQVDAHVNLIYSSLGNAKDDNLHDLGEELLHCMSRLPSYKLQFEEFKLELHRNYSTLSVFTLAGSDSTHLRRIIHMLNTKQPYKELQKYIFVWRNAREQDMQQLFKAIWDKQIPNAIVVKGANSVYTFEPFTTTGFLVRQWLTGEPYFYDKLKNLHHFQLRISMFKDFLRAIPKSSSQLGYTGVDGLMASSIVSQLNATVQYVMPEDNENYGACLENGSYTGVLRDLLGGRTHVNFNAQFVLPCVAERIETLYPYFKRILYVVVPAAEMFPEYLIFVYAYKDSVWQIFVAFFFLVVAAFALLKWAIETLSNVEKMKDGRWYDLIELFWKVQLGVPINYFSSTHTLRLFLMAWILFNYVMTSIYFAKVESIFVHASYYPEIDRLDGLHALDVPIFGVQNIFTAVKPALKPQHWRAIERHAVLLPQQFSSFQYAVPIAVRKHWRVAYLLRGETARDLLAKTYDAERRRPRFHVVKEHMLAMPQTYLLPKGSPFRYKFQEFESRVLESGIFEYWTHNAPHKRVNGASPDLEEFRHELPNDLNFEAQEIDVADDKEKKVVLNMRILQGPFYMWAFGMGISFLGFLLEHAYCWWRRPSVFEL